MRKILENKFNNLILLTINKRELKKVLKLKIIVREGATFTTFGYKERITEKNRGQLSKEEKESGLEYRTKLIKTKDVSTPRFRITQKKKT